MVKLCHESNYVILSTESSNVPVSSMNSSILTCPNRLSQLSDSVSGYIICVPPDQGRKYQVSAKYHPGQYQSGSADTADTPDTDPILNPIGRYH